ncbi:GNAT family N-acetyltransferase [Halapricum salinum]|uniref:GNAT family N-acetyltransferase n=1 Tax=Halapricum salinum TaxID=1457250 RepID=A0A4D6HD83_9EURY|nr:GNAT family N-acetyltransferase [Halapricum salinum]QCC51022.1 GNAT family N-acetyltransferase [Halapricum salinum]
MTETRIEELTSDAQWDAAVPILGQLWEEKTSAEIRSWREEDDYRLFGLFDDDVIVAVAGVSIQRVLHHVRHAWIHDLVVDEAHQRSGYGQALLAHVESWARERECEYVALALVDGNDSAGGFYREQGMERWGDVIEKPLQGEDGPVEERGPEEGGGRGLRDDEE